LTGVAELQLVAGAPRLPGHQLASYNGVTGLGDNMKLSLNREAEQLITERINSGKYATAEDVVTAALFALKHEEGFGGFAPGELDSLIEEGEGSGPAMTGETFLAQWRALRSAAKESGV
jgi:putative addiction module CopG family antidote